MTDLSFLLAPYRGFRPTRGALGLRPTDPRFRRVVPAPTPHLTKTS